MPKGWFLPVVPGTRFVCVGGAIASDIHGKNHHRDGCFSEFVDSLDLMLADGTTVSCSRTENGDLFHATCGGMGLTGMILSARLRLLAIKSASLEQTTVVAPSLNAVMDAFESHQNAHYSVAWLDCMAGGRDTGRSLLYLGEHSEQGRLIPHGEPRLSVPFSTPGMLLNTMTMGAFNRLYFAMGQRGKAVRQLHYGPFFFPLDGISHWNRLYGGRGFLQYQFVVPTEGARAAITAVLGKVQAQGKGSFLSVLKKMGKANQNLLSFPMDGYTLTLDFKFQRSLMPLLDELDAIVLDHGGRLYLAKDARMSKKVFRASYPHWETFMEIRHRVDPRGVFGSLQSQRLGLSGEAA